MSLIRQCFIPVSTSFLHFCFAATCVVLIMESCRSQEVITSLEADIAQLEAKKDLTEQEKKKLDLLKNSLRIERGFPLDEEESGMTKVAPEQFNLETGAGTPVGESVLTYCTERPVYSSLGKPYALVASHDDSGLAVVESGRSSLLPFHLPVRFAGATGFVPVRPNQPLARPVVSQQFHFDVSGQVSLNSGKPTTKVVVTGVMETTDQTPDRFVSDGDDGKKDQLGASSGGPIITNRGSMWEAYTTNGASPPFTKAGTDGRYTFQYNFGVNYSLDKGLPVGPGDDVGRGLGEPDNWTYKAAFSYDFNYGCAKIPMKDLANGTPIPPTEIDDREQLINGSKRGLNLSEVDKQFVSHGLGNFQESDNQWDSPFTPNIWYLIKIPEDNIPKFSEFSSWHFDPIGRNNGITTAPAPAWKPEHWLSGHPRSLPTARVTRKGERP
jgi:hypothetical protein